MRFLPFLSYWKPRKPHYQDIHARLVMSAFGSAAFMYSTIETGADTIAASPDLASLWGHHESPGLDRARTAVTLLGSADSVFHARYSIQAAKFASDTSRSARLYLSEINVEPEFLGLRLESQDAENLGGWDAIDGIPAGAMSFPLWGTKRPANIAARWRRWRRTLVDDDESNTVWVDWFDRRLRGDNTTWGLGALADDKVSHRLISQDGGFWEQEPRAINTAILHWIDDAKREIQEPPVRQPEGSSNSANRIADDEFQKRLIDLASPDIRFVDGKLDAGPNPVFDQVEYGPDLLQVPQILQVLSESIIGSVPENAPKLIVQNLTLYQAHIVENGIKPVLGIVRPLGNSVLVEYGADDGLWSQGLAILFEEFRDAHALYLKHFPRDSKRDEAYDDVDIEDLMEATATLNAFIPELMEMLEELKIKGVTTPAFDELNELYWPLGKDLVAPIPGNEDRTSVARAKAIKHYAINAWGVLRKTVVGLSVLITLTESDTAKLALKLMSGFAMALYGLFS